MSRYGINFYGPGTYYGEIPLIEFDARPLTAQSKNYGEVTLRWEPPSGDWDLLRVTRDSYGFAPRADMGTTVLEVAKETGAAETFTEAGLQPGRFYYYTVWVRATIDDQWRRAGDVIALVTFDHGYRQYMFELIPSVYRDKDMDTPQYRIYGRGQLERFMEIFGYEADHIRTEYETLKYVNDPQRCSGGLLPLMADQLGFGYENELGMRLARQQMKNAVYIYKHKGTQLGLEAVTSALTGWAPTVTQGYNLALDQNISAASEGVGSWVNSANATVGRRSVTDASAPGVITGPVAAPPGASTGDVGSGSWYHLITAIGAGDMTIQAYAAGTALDNRTKTIPVTGGLIYTLSVYSRALDTVRSVQIGVEWFDKNGTSLGAVTWGTATANLTGSWTRHTYSPTAPANAVFMRPSIRAQSAAAGNRIALGAFQVEQNATARAYQGARSVRIKFDAERVNLVPNASFEVNANDWTGAVRSTAQMYVGSASGFVAEEAVATVPLTSLLQHTVSAYVLGPGGTYRLGTLDQAVAFEDQYVYITGTSTGYGSLPDNAGVSVTGDIDIRFKVAADDWVTGTAQTIVAKWATSTTRSYRVGLGSTGNVFFGYSTDGSNQFTDSVANVVDNFVPGQAYWLRVQKIAATGVMTVYAAPDGINWVSVGTTTQGSGLAWHDNNSPVEIGAQDGGTGNRFAGKIYYIEIRNGSTVAAAFSPMRTRTTAVRTPTSWGDDGSPTAPTWTMNGTGWNWGVFPSQIISIPDTSALSINGDLEITAKVTFGEMLPNTQTIVSNRIGAGGYTLRMGGRGLNLTWHDGTNSRNTSSNALLPFVPGDTAYVRVTLDVDNGAGGHAVTYYTSTDGVAFTPLGTVTNAGAFTTSIGNAPDPLEVGSSHTGGQRWWGKIHMVEVRSGIAGTVVAKFDPSSPAAVTTATTHTVPSLAEALRLPGVSGNTVSQPDSLAINVAGNLDLRAWVSADDWSQVGKYMIYHRGTNTGYGFRVHSATAGRLELIWGDGTTTFFVSSSVAVPFANGAGGWVRGTLTLADRTVRFYTSTDGVTWTPLGATSTPGAATTIAPATGTALVVGGDLGVATWNGLLYAVEIRDDIDGEVVAAFNAGDVVATAMRTPATVGSWTINGTAWSWHTKLMSPSTGVYRSPGITGNYIGTPTEAALNIAGDIDIRILATMDNWAAAFPAGRLLGKWVTNNRQYYIGVDGGGLRLGFSLDGIAELGATIALGANLPAAGARKWVRVTRVAASGLITAYVSDDGVSWTSVGTSTQATGNLNTTATTAALTVGGTDSGSNIGTGYIHRVEIYNGIAGTLAAWLDIANLPITAPRTPGTTFVQGGRTWTMNGSAWSWVNAPAPSAWTLTGGGWEWDGHGEVAEVVVPPFEWTRISQTVTPDEQSLKITVDGPGPFYLDGVMAERGDALGEFFDGTSYSNEGEYMWGLTPGNSPSYYYSRRLIKNFRLNQRLPEFLPAGAAWALLYAEQT